jgi:hypothetical protein
MGFWFGLLVVCFVAHGLSLILLAHCCRAHG